MDGRFVVDVWGCGGVQGAGCVMGGRWGVGWTMRCYGAVICLYAGGVAVVRDTAVPRAVYWRCGVGCGDTEMR